jgi:hypothetical protein
MTPQDFQAYLALQQQVIESLQRMMIALEQMIVVAANPLICKLPSGESLNLNQIRSIQWEEPPLLVLVTWANGDRSIYRQGEALTLLLAWDEANDDK